MHWEYHLFRAIEAEIVGFETLNRERLLKKKRRKYDTDDPDRILELLDEKKMVDQVCIYISFCVRLIILSIAMETSPELDGTRKEYRNEKSGRDRLMVHLVILPLG